MLLRVVLLLVLAILLARFLVRLAGLAAAALREGSSPHVSQRPPVPLVACHRCGVFVPRAEAAAVFADGVLCRACAGG